jgi:hypothetical protein
MLTFGELLEKSVIDKTVADMAKESGVPTKILMQVFDRGIAAWHNSAGGKSTPEAWGYGRVNKFLDKRSKVRKTIDKDLADQINKA